MDTDDYNYNGNLMIKANFIKCKLLMQQGKVDDAIDEISSLIRKDKDNEEFLFFRVKLFLLSNKPAKAIDDLKKLKRMNFQPAQELYTKYSVE